MIYRFTFLLVFVLNSWLALAQPGNLVENPSFEFRPECDDNNGPLEEAPPWFNPTAASPDVFHECAVQLEDPCPYPDQVFLDPWLFGVPTNTVGCQTPRTGAGYAGGTFRFPDPPADFVYREYLAVPLSEQLVAGEEYLVRFYVSLAERSLYSIHAIQVAFLATMITSSENDNLELIPQLSNENGNFIEDKIGWTELSWEYTADGTEQYMYIGNFQNNIEIDTLFAVPDSIDPEDHFGTYYYIDDVYVGTDLLSIDNEEINNLNIWPNPAVNNLHIRAERLIDRISVYSIDGKLLVHKIMGGQDYFIIDLGGMAQGVYILRLCDHSGYFLSKKFVKR